MAQTVLITLTTAGADTGPFDLFSDADGYVVAFENDVPKASLVSGYTSTLVPDLATIIRVKSDGACTNYIDLPIVTTTTTTSTSSTTTTTSTSSTTTTTSSTSTTTTTTSSTSTTTTTTTEPPPPPTCSVYEITNAGATQISWVGNNCVTGDATGGTVNPGQTVFTGCVYDSTFAYGDNGSVTVTSTPC